MADSIQVTVDETVWDRAEAQLAAMQRGVSVVKVTTRRQEKLMRTRVYAWLVGQNVMENLVLRGAEPVKVLREAAVQALKSEFGLDVVARGKETSTSVSMYWSRHAGCSCNCSPGFVVSRTLYGTDKVLGPVDLFLDVTVD